MFTRRILGLFLSAWLGMGVSAAWAAGPFHYQLPRGSGVDLEAVTVLGQPQTHHIVRYENLYQIAQEYDLGFWELARYHRILDHFYLPWDTDIAIPTQWIIPERSSYPGYLINVAELRGYRFFPEKRQVRTYPIGIGVLDYKTPIGKKFRVQSKSVNPGCASPRASGPSTVCLLCPTAMKTRWAAAGWGCPTTACTAPMPPWGWAAW